MVMPKMNGNTTPSASQESGDDAGAPMRATPSSYRAALSGRSDEVVEEIRQIADRLRRELKMDFAETGRRIQADLRQELALGLQRRVSVMEASSFEDSGGAMGMHAMSSMLPMCVGPGNGNAVNAGFEAEKPTHLANLLYPPSSQLVAEARPGGFQGLAFAAGNGPYPPEADAAGGVGKAVNSASVGNTSCEEQQDGDEQDQDLSPVQAVESARTRFNANRHTTENRGALLTMDRLRLQAHVRTQRKDTWKGLSVFRLSELLESPKFDNFCGLVIIVNALTIGYGTDYCARHFTTTAPFFVDIMETLFCLWFASELILRLWVKKLAFYSYRTDGFMWNCLDTVLVIAQIAEIGISVISSSNPDGMRYLRVLRILRVVRIFRVVRVFHLITELRTIVSSILGSFRSLAWTVVLLFLMIYIVAVYFTQSITDSLVLTNDDVTQITATQSILVQHFGSLGGAILCLWQAMSGGVDWEEVATPILSEMGIVYGLAFTSYIAFALLALMNVVTGVFVQAALQSARREEDNFMTDQIVQLFEVGTHGSTISLNEVERSLNDPKTAKEWKAIGISEEEATHLFKLLDLDFEGEVPLEEFLAGCLRLNGSAKAMDLLTVMQESRKANYKTSARMINVEDGIDLILESLQTMMSESEGQSNCSMQLQRLQDLVAKVHWLCESMQRLQTATAHLCAAAAADGSPTSPRSVKAKEDEEQHAEHQPLSEDDTYELSSPLLNGGSRQDTATDLAEAEDFEAPRRLLPEVAVIAGDRKMSSYKRTEKLRGPMAVSRPDEEQAGVRLPCLDELSRWSSGELTPVSNGASVSVAPQAAPMTNGQLEDMLPTTPPMTSRGQSFGQEVSPTASTNMQELHNRIATRRHSLRMKESALQKRMEAAMSTRPKPRHNDLTLQNPV
eukprot:TRINITY_DN65074_c0_g1_i1.p1 TRINITY_DN65074_c0_g1~~TRINITY_DN65074_c0_g1_i1.p1  ORF type:complete len:904 (-),score=230.33 TRINITY_DN65074_c0_g1_i1:130-2841(-)